MVEKLKVKSASFSYDGKINIFEKVSFSIESGDVLCILGPNGAGKSTLIMCMGHILNLTEGRVWLYGRDMAGLNHRQIAQKIGYIPQRHNPVFPYSVLDVVLMGRAAHLGRLSSPGRKDRDIAQKAIERVGIPHLIKKPYTEISGGEMQLVLIAMVLAQEPSILLLDEPTSHLDFGNQVRILNVITGLAEEGLSIIMSSHFPDHAFVTANKAAIMKQGESMLMGEPDVVITEETMRTTYGVDVKILSLDSDSHRKVCIPLH